MKTYKEEAEIYNKRYRNYKNWLRKEHRECRKRAKAVADVWDKRGAKR